MARKRTGTYWRHGDHFDVRVTLNDGSRPVIHLEGVSDEPTAKATAERYASLAAAGRLVLTKNAGPSLTFWEWFGRWTEDRTERGIVTARRDVGRAAKWVKPSIGDTQIGDVTKADIENMVEAFDRAAASYAEAEKTNTPRDLDTMMSWKSAINLWGIVRKAFDDAHRGKTRSLRVLEANPCADVKGPDRGAKKARQHLSPSRFSSFVALEAVPPIWRRAVTLAIYIYPRAAELRGLRWEDVHLADGFLVLHRTERKAKRARPRRARLATCRSSRACGHCSRRCAESPVATAR